MRGVQKNPVRFFQSTLAEKKESTGCTEPVGFKVRVRCLRHHVLCEKRPTAAPPSLHTDEVEPAVRTAPRDAQETTAAELAVEDGRRVVRFRRNKVFVVEFLWHFIFRHLCHEAQEVIGAIFARLFALGAEELDVFCFANRPVETDEVEILCSLYQLKRHRLVGDETIVVGVMTPPYAFLGGV